MHGLIARYHTVAGQRDEVVRILLEEMRPLVSRNEPDCMIYRVNKAQNDESLVLLYEEYASMEALTGHRTTEHYQEIIQGKVAPLLENRVVEIFEVVE